LEEQARPDQPWVAKDVAIVESYALIDREQLGPALLVAEKARTDPGETIALTGRIPAPPFDIGVDCFGRLRH